MRAGDRWELYIPSELAYGSRGAGGKIGADEVLIFDLELLSLSTGGVGPVEKVMAVMSTPVLGPLAPWHLVLLALLAYRFLGSGGGGRKVAASHILVKEEEVCEKLKALGSAFAALAAEHSTCPSGKRGGALGEFGPGQMVPAFDKVCWDAPLMEVQGPVQTGFGFHLILVTKRTDPAADKAK
mmetsp:Transcript_20685/g.61049  ORF Transcript_20685/g.61049 Transcript_20685/m.61049 type:complete len:183 (+) Transcript_20685:388-936(+)